MTDRLHYETYPEMLLLPGGRERTADEFTTLFQQTGFRLKNILGTKSSLNVIEAEKVY